MDKAFARAKITRDCRAGTRDLVPGDLVHIDLADWARAGHPGPGVMAYAENSSDSSLGLVPSDALTEPDPDREGPRVEIGISRSMPAAGRDLVYAAIMADENGRRTPVTRDGQVVAWIVPAGGS